MSSSISPIIAQVYHASPDAYVSAFAGIQRKTLVDGGRTQLVEFRLAAGSVVPPHQHPQEQTGYLVSGHLLLTIAGVDHEMRPGDSWTIPGNVEHQARSLGESVAIEIFSPIRRDYRS
jgi:quercetin dioxygenase-like cupin family protein